MTSKEYNEQVLKAIIHGTTNPKQKRDGCSVTESQIQIACVDWFKLQYRQLFEDGVLFHIPNERQCSYALGARLKREACCKRSCRFMFGIDAARIWRTLHRNEKARQLSETGAKDLGAKHYKARIFIQSYQEFR